MMNNNNKQQSLSDDNAVNLNNKSTHLYEYPKNNKIKISIEYDDITETLSSSKIKTNQSNAPIQTNMNNLNNYANSQWFSNGGMNSDMIHNQTSPYYGNYIPLSDQIPIKDSNYPQEIKMQSNQALSKIPLNQINQYISFQNHFHCYPFPLFQYVPFYPSNFNPQTQNQKTLNKTHNQNQPHQETTNTTIITNNTEAVIQIELLFSFSYLNKDIYFRSSMDQNGWMPLNILMTIISIKRLHIHSDQIVQFLNHSKKKTVELKTDNDEGYFIRKINWEEFSKGLLDIDEIKRQKLNKPQNHYLCSYLKDAHVENAKEFTGAL